MPNPRTTFELDARDRTARAFDRVNARLQGLIGTAGKVSAAFTGITAAIGGAGIVSELRELSKLDATLLSATGSAEGAALAFTELGNFATATGQQTEDVVQAFVRLKNLGLDPSIEALRAYGDIAAGTGKTTIDFAEAVADAVTGEFERLKEFGIKSAKEGERIQFTFKGITREVENSGQEIERFLQELAKTEFAGNLENQANSLDGSFKRIGASFSSLSREIGEAGLTKVLTNLAIGFSSFVDSITSEVRELRALFGLVGDDSKDLDLLQKRLARVQVEAAVARDALREGSDRRPTLERALSAIGIEIEPGQAFFDRQNRIIKEAEDEEKRLRKLIEEVGKTNEELGKTVFASTGGGGGVKPAPIKVASGPDPLKELESRFAKLKESLRTPVEAFEATLSELKKLQDAGIGDAETFARAQAEAARQLGESLGVGESLDAFKAYVAAINDARQKDLVKNKEYTAAIAAGQDILDATVNERTNDIAQRLAQQQQDAADDVAQAWESAGQTIAGSFEDLVLEGKKLQDVFSDILKTIARTALQRSVTEPLGRRLGDFLGSAFGNLGNIFRAQGGADFIVGSNTGPEIPGIDNRLLTLRVKDGERVRVDPLTQPRQQQGAASIVINEINISASDLESFRGSASQIGEVMNEALVLGARNS